MTDAEKALLEAAMSNAGDHKALHEARVAVQIERLGPVEAELRQLIRESIRIGRALGPYYRELGSVAQRIYDEEMEKREGS